MRIQALFAALLVFSLSAGVTLSHAAGVEFGGQCAMSWAKGQQVMTDCSIHWVNQHDGRTFCFSSPRAKEAFLQAPEENAAKAMRNYEKFQRARDG